jgi:hypothetical protein
VDVNSFLRKTDPRLRPLVESLRALVRKTVPDAVEQVKWGMPIYSKDGECFASLMVARDHVNLELFHGARMGSKLLEGTGKTMRRVKLMSRRDVDAKELTRLLRRAVALSKRAGA